jgi:hypothetical protein
MTTEERLIITFSNPPSPSLMREVHQLAEELRRDGIAVRVERRVAPSTIEKKDDEQEKNVAISILEMALSYGGSKGADWLISTTLDRIRSRRIGEFKINQATHAGLESDEKRQVNLTDHEDEGKQQ